MCFRILLFQCIRRYVCSFTVLYASPEVLSGPLPLVYSGRTGKLAGAIVSGLEEKYKHRNIYMQWYTHLSVRPFTVEGDNLHCVFPLGYFPPNFSLLWLTRIFQNFELERRSFVVMHQPFFWYEVQRRLRYMPICIFASASVLSASGSITTFYNSLIHLVFRTMVQKRQWQDGDIALECIFAHLG